MKYTKIFLALDEQDHMPNHGEISIQIYKKFINMGLGEDISFQQFLLDFLKMKKHIFLDYATQLENQFYF